MHHAKTLAAILVAATVAWAAPADAEDPALAIHVLDRLAFGPDAASLKAIRALGVDGWIDRQLDPASIPEPAMLTERLDRLETQRLDAVRLFETYGPPARTAGGADPSAVKAARQRARIIVREAAMGRLMRAVTSPRQLQEVMVDFWFNHFNVFARKGLDHLWVGDYENRAIRPFALGRFRDLLEATARHPAMLVYLDNWQNAAPGSPGAKGGSSGLNENYARELMELHTLGVDGGYVQADVIALARILTGWGIAPQGRAPSENGFFFNPRRHDFGDKRFLGRTIHGEGAAEIEQALDILATSPATARHISTELAQYFVADRPPPALVDRLTQRWLASGGDIRAVLTVLFASPEFRSPDDFGRKFKTPFEYVVSAVRAGGLDVSNFRPLLGTMARLGEPLYGCLAPDGYKNTRDAWLSPDALTVRISFAMALGAGRLPLNASLPAENAGAPEPPAPAMAPMPLDAGRLLALLQPTLSATTQEVVQGAPPSMKAALILGSPDFMTR
ncbi:DUF1800 domain-containing protein [Rhodopila globiformis]|uniref:DUF1800 domain-containing protein n=1 Tax=Rhodopila globiformis TaxID=1071 RepID=A0A2S6NFV2_RHOGL|nr:DUF1800 domain-containing protein [Rhodopila globiformis]PPQ33474.1 hypothetical protein CCS01_14170 [Rhodopila globiformis]